jgi:hypothetical protein
VCIDIWPMCVAHLEAYVPMCRYYIAHPSRVWRNTLELFLLQEYSVVYVLVLYFSYPKPIHPI